MNPIKLKIVCSDCKITRYLILAAEEEWTDRYHNPEANLVESDQCSIWEGERKVSKESLNICEWGDVIRVCVNYHLTVPVSFSPQLFVRPEQGKLDAEIKWQLTRFGEIRQEYKYRGKKWIVGRNDWIVSAYLVGFTVQKNIYAQAWCQQISSTMDKWFTRWFCLAKINWKESIILEGKQGLRNEGDTKERLNENDR